MDDTSGATDDFMPIREAAEYVGVSPQTLRRWDAAGKLKSIRHPVNGYRHYRRTDLEPFRLLYRRAEMQAGVFTDYFAGQEAHIDGNELLREPQRVAHARVAEHFEHDTQPAIVQIPVGCGKTGVMAILPFGIARGRVLVIAPNTTIREGVAQALDVASPKCFWTKTKVLRSVSNGPYCAVLDGPNANIHDCTESQFVVTNIQQLASSADRWLPQFPPDFFDMILIDEGHHNVAPSWQRVFEKFPNAKVVSLTATPFRGDGQRPAGEIVYRYPFSRAMLQGYIKQIHSVSFAPAEISFTYRGSERRHSLEEVMELREETWFRRGVALAPECNRHIAEASIVRCLNLRQKTGLKHQIIASACSVDHARQVRSIYQELGLEAREIYGEMTGEEKEAVFRALDQGRIDCIVQVQMLGEGFDHPPLSVAAVFRPYRSLSAYVQFVGRIMRVNEEGDPAHPDNFGYIVSHVGLNNDEHWSDFREFDLEDQKLLNLWVTGGTHSSPTTPSTGGGSPRRFDIGMLVDNEIVSHFIDSVFLDPDDDRVLDLIVDQKIPGTPFRVGDLKSRDELREMLQKKRREQAQAPSDLPKPSPQRRRVEATRRLAERTGSVVARVLRDLGLAMPGREIGKAIGRGGDNRSVLTSHLNREINDLLGIKRGMRKSITADQAEEAFAQLDSLGDKVCGQIREALEE